MTRVVLAFEPVGIPPEDQVVLKLEDAPTDIPNMGCNAPTDVSDIEGSIMQRGTELRDRLGLHPPVKMGLEAALMQPAVSPPMPLYFRMVSSRADQLPWEELFDQERKFVALDARWPIVRIAARRRKVSPRGFSPPLRLVAVLAAAGYSAVPQAETLLAAIRSPNAAHIGVHLHIISGDSDVLDTVAAAGLPGLVTAEFLPGTDGELAQKITDAHPDILHMLCHGGAIGGGEKAGLRHSRRLQCGQEPRAAGTAWRGRQRASDAVPADRGPEIVHTLAGSAERLPVRAGLTDACTGP
ncbi:hypothetical protein E4N62_45480 [Streptomyces sp. MNU76]|uniref:hypothetical protein n=1 Tax=Streptomyces sp. MNU76 TaxID=2560026 RepID=UPI001E3E9E0B|nr:hypothetical protein [Streptomyces sp. MNU76]MCC9711835.1 hypothetical protein [Streptomyces sp. MNU76]